MIVLCGNSTGFDGDQLIPGGQSDRYLSPILGHLPAGSRIARQPVEGAVCALTNHWQTYRHDARRLCRVSVQISHGIADKGYRSYTRAAQYDFVVYPGPALADRAIVEGLDPRRVRVLGYPKLDPLHAGQVDSPWPARDGRIRVLWAPTHGGGSERWADGNPKAPGADATTWWRRDELLSLLDPELVLVMEAPHPRHSPGRQATLAQYVGADVVIGDGGSSMYEAWCLDIPVVFADWLTGHRNLTRAGGKLLEHEVYARRIGWHAATPDDFPAMLARAAASGISPTEQAFAQRVLPVELRGHGGRLHAQFLTEVDSGAVGDPGGPGLARHRARRERVARQAALSRIRGGT